MLMPLISYEQYCQVIISESATKLHQIMAYHKEKKNKEEI